MKKFFVAGLLLLTLTGWLAFHWGLWSYLVGVSQAGPSLNSKRKDDLLLAAENARGSVLLLHGLNFDASKLESLAEVFAENGLSVTAPRLAGHRGVLEETFSVPTEDWYSQVRQWSSTLKRPLICSGYSLGGLLVTERFLQGDLPCDGFVLFAPALELRTPRVLLHLLRKLTVHDFKVPSAVPQAYVHFGQTGMGPTYALEQVLQNFDRLIEQKGSRALPPGLVFVDPRDKVIAAAGVVNKLRTHFPHWKIVTLESVDRPENQSYHLVVDEFFLGPAQWKIMNVEIAELIERASGEDHRSDSADARDPAAASRAAL